MDLFQDSLKAFQPFLYYLPRDSPRDSSRYFFDSLGDFYHNSSRKDSLKVSRDDSKDFTLDCF